MRSRNSTDRTKIVIVVTSSRSARTFVGGFARFCASRGFEVTIIADGVEPLTREVADGVVRQIPVRMERDPRPLQDLLSLIELTRTLKQIRPDILVYGTPKASLLGSIAGAILRVPKRIYQLRGLRLETVSGPKRSMLVFFERVTSRLSTKVLANSRSLAARYEELNLSSGRKVDLLGMGSSQGVDLEKFSRGTSYAELGVQTKQFLRTSNSGLVIGFVGRLHVDKGVDTLLESIRLLKVNDANIRLLLVGSDEGAHLDLSDGLENDVHLVGSVADTRPYYEAMDVLILPSLREGFPNVVLEAAAMRVPAIVSDGTGVVDSVIDEETGIVVPVGESQALARAVTRLADDSLLRITLGTAARRFVEEHFAQEKVWDRTLIFLEN